LILDLTSEANLGEQIGVESRITDSISVDSYVKDVIDIGSFLYADVVAKNLS
jgi:hypothetical protein